MEWWRKIIMDLIGEVREEKQEKRDYTCQDCGITEEEYGKELSVHHIIPFRNFMVIGRSE